MYSLKLDKISKNYYRNQLFNDISFELNQGDILAITGWNGSGKSTLLRIIAGLVRPSAGEIYMFYRQEPVPVEFRRKFIGMVSPALSLYDELTPLENIKFFCKVRGVQYDQASCIKILKDFGLTGHIHKICKNYSSGMKQRLKLVQAIIHKPGLLLLDEPGSNLDTNGMKIVESMIFEQQKSGIIIIASNEQREVDYAQRIINLSE